MISEKSLKFAPPWATSPAWREANYSIGIHVKRYDADLKPAVTMARDLLSRLTSIFSVLNDLCMATCPWCPEVCCLTASPWYDFRDLLFLHLNHLEIPRTQPVHAYGTTCCYLKSRGCSLTRILRPWICIWYLCPVQRAYLKKTRRRNGQAFHQLVSEIKDGREKLEEEFIRVIS